MWIDPGEVAVKTFWRYAKGGTEEIVYKKHLSPEKKIEPKTCVTATSDSVIKRVDPKLLYVKKMEIPMHFQPTVKSIVKTNQQTRSVLEQGGIWSSMSVGGDSGWDAWDKSASIQA